MTMFEIFWQPEIRKYRASLFSRATLFQILCVAITVLAPLFIAYRSHGFWIKEDTYREQPYVSYKYQSIILLQTSAGQLGWSTIPNMNALLVGNGLLTPSVSVQEVDNNLDGKNDWMILQMDIPLADTVIVYSVKLLLVFDYAIVRMSQFRMESLGVIDYSSSLPGAVLSVSGDLNLKQKNPLGYKGTDNRFVTPIIDTSKVQAVDYQVSNIISNYQQRNVTTAYENALYSWESDRPAGQPFKLNATIYYTTPVVTYRPGFWYALKWAWVQYASLLFVLVFVLDRVKAFVFENQIVPTMVQRPQLDCGCKSL